MRLVFLCSALDRDGVGDYTRALAGELERHSVECQAIGLNESSLNGIAESDSELRLSSSLPWDTRMKAAQNRIRSFDPDWISLQFVPYGFHPRGLIFGLAPRLSALVSGRRIHVMFHELWIGEGKGATLKDRVQGFLQKRLVLDMIRKLSPKVIHANCSAYVAILKRNGLSAERLPLFGSVPIAENNADSWLFPILNARKIAIGRESRARFWLIGLFGALHPQWTAEPHFSQLRAAAGRDGRQCVVLSMGRRGSAGDRLWKRLSDDAPKLSLIDLGELSAERISQALQSLDFGIAATPRCLIGKSASVAAMLDHGLPVIVTRDDFRLRFAFEPEEMRNPLLAASGTQLIETLAHLRPCPPQSSLGDVAKKFLSSLGVREDAQTARAR